jgi:hypothetical protein
MTSRLFTAAWLVTAAILSSWAVSSASDEPRPAAPMPVTLVEQPLPDLSIELDAEISRLASRTSAAAPAAASRRDLFTFAARKMPPRRRPLQPLMAAPAPPDALSPAAIAPTVEPLPPAVPTEPLIDQPALRGVAEITAGTLTAVISFNGDLHYVRHGDVMAGRYRIDGVAMDGVDVFDLAAGTILRLRLHSVIYNSH